MGDPGQLGFCGLGLGRPCVRLAGTHHHGAGLVVAVAGPGPELVEPGGECHRLAGVGGLVRP